MNSKRFLTEDERKLVWEAISRNRAADDRDPREIIEEDYNGDEDRYLRVMADWHNVPIEN